MRNATTLTTAAVLHFVGITTAAVVLTTTTTTTTVIALISFVLPFAVHSTLGLARELTTRGTTTTTTTHSATTPTVATTKAA